MDTITVDFNPDGTVSAIWDDRIQDFLTLPGLATRRASNVEPGDPTKRQDPNQWYADMSPSGHPVVMGPFIVRGDALKAETEWLLTHNHGAKV